MRVILLSIIATLPMRAVVLHHEGTTMAYADTCAGLQSALNAAAGGDIVELGAGIVYACGAQRVVFPKHAGERYVSVRTSAYRNLPDGNTRICPAGSIPVRQGKCAPNMQSSGGAPGSSGGDLAIIEFGADFAHGFQAALGAHHWRFLGLEIRGESHLTWSTLFTLSMQTAPGGACTQGYCTSIADRAHAIEIDRCWLHGYYQHYGPQKGVQADGAGIVIRNSVVEEIKASGQDAQAIYDQSGPGPLIVENCFLAGAGENFMSGGAASAWRGSVPGFLKFTGNNSTRDTRWWIKSGAVDPAQTSCTEERLAYNTATGVWRQCIGGTFQVLGCGANCPDRNIYSTVKNLFEFKAMKVAQMAGNAFDNSWNALQRAAIVLLNTASTQNKYLFTVDDIRFHHNRVANTFDAVAIGAASPDYLPGSRVRIEHNVFDSVMMPERTGSLGDLYIGSSFLFLTGPRMLPYGTAIRHNTVINSAQPATYLGYGFNTFGLYGAGAGSTECPYCQFLDNVLPWNNQPVTGDSGPTGATFFGVGWQHHWDYGMAAGNIIAKNGRVPGASYVNAFATACCRGNQIAGAMSDALDSGNRVKAPYRGTATDGSDPGADMNTLAAMTGRAASGQFNPYLTFRLGSWTADSTGATVHYQAPAAPGAPEGACTLRVSAQESLAAPVGVVGQNETGTARTAVIRGLNPGTFYYFAVTCGEATYRGNFRTRVR